MIRKLLALPLVAALGLAGVAGAASSADAHHRTPPPTIAGIVSQSGGTFDGNNRDFDILLTAVQAAGLAGALDDASASLTVFAPNDKAFIRTARSLGYTGEWSEAGAWNFLVGALTQIGGGDPIPVLTNILKYHVAPKKLDALHVLFSRKVDTLLGTSFGVRFLELVDNEPDIRNPYLDITGLNIRASNGYIHVITRVLIPVNL